MREDPAYYPMGKARLYCIICKSNDHNTRQHNDAQSEKLGKEWNETLEKGYESAQKNAEAVERFYKSKGGR